MKKIALLILFLVGCLMFSHAQNGVAKRQNGLTSAIDLEGLQRMSPLSALVKVPLPPKKALLYHYWRSSLIQKSNRIQLYFRNPRRVNFGYYVDGMRHGDSLRGVLGSSIGSIAVYVGGIPAKYGDYTDGVVVIETKSYFDLLRTWQATSRY